MAIDEGFGFSNVVQKTYDEVIQLLSNVTVTGPGDWVPTSAFAKSVVATLTGTGTLSATINVEVSDDGDLPLQTLPGTITLSNLSPKDGFAINAVWPFIRMNVISLSGTAATLNGTMRV